MYLTSTVGSVVVNSPPLSILSLASIQVASYARVEKIKLPEISIRSNDVISLGQKLTPLTDAATSSPIGAVCSVESFCAKRARK